MYWFGDCEVDPAGRELRLAGAVVHLEPQAFDLLVHLIEHRDRVVTKNDLLDGVWGHRFVSEANLTTRVKEVRKAVGDDGARQLIIRTARGLGYRFVAALDDDDVDDGAAVASSAGLIGRDELIAEITGQLGHSPLVTLIGPGGVGKSSIARAVAASVVSSFGDGVHLVELANIDAGQHVLPAIARALDIVLDNDRPHHALRSLANLDALLVVDNCEHVVDDVSELLDRVLSFGVGGGLRVLATSQMRLGLSVEHVHRVEPLSADRAVELFDARARVTQPSWQPDQIDRARVARLLSSLDHLPLTIEMAAARLGSMTFDELEAAIDHGAHLLQVNHRSPARRHRSLGSLVAWSAALLDADDRRTFAELSVFAGPVSASDVAEVIGPERSGNVVFTLGSLADRSLLVAATDGLSTRYRMLSTVRAVAGRWLDDDDAEADDAEADDAEDAATDVRRRHAMHFANVIRDVDRVIRTPREIEGRRRLDAVVDEVRAAHHWAQRHEPELAADISGALQLASYSTFWNEPVEWARSLLARHPDATADELLGARLIVAGSAANRGDLEVARAEVAGASRSNDLRARATAVEILSDVGLYAGDLDGVAASTDELRLLGAELADSHWEVIAAVNAALAFTYADRPREGIERLAELELAESSPSDRAWATYARGEALSALGEPDATDAYMSAIRLARSVGNPFVVSVSQVSLASELARAGSNRQALDAFAECLHDYARHGNYVHAVTSLRNMIEVLVAVGDDHGAAVIGVATSSDLLRQSYGPEAERLSDVLGSVERRVGPTRFAEWVIEGNGLGVATTVQFAGQRIAQLTR